MWGLGSWWGVDLGVSVPAASIVVLNLAASLMAAVAARFGDLAPLDFGLANPVCAITAGAGNATATFFSCSVVSGRFLTVESQAGLLFCEVQIYTVPPSKYRYVARCVEMCGIALSLHL